MTMGCPTKKKVIGGVSTCQRDGGSGFDETNLEPLVVGDSTVVGRGKLDPSMKAPGLKL